MSFSAEVKKNLSKITNFSQEILQAELIGYLLSGNAMETEEYFEFVTENEFNIEHLYKLLFNLKVEYEPETRGKCFVAQMNKKQINNLMKEYEKIPKQIQKNVLKGAFLGAGSVNDPKKNYHLELIFNQEEQADDLQHICEEFDIKFKKIKVNHRYQLYLKESDEISKFLALIGANRAVLEWEDVRVLKEMKNHINRKVNCETANLNKTVEAALKQIEDIHLIQKKRKFDDLPEELRQVAKARLENPELSLQELSALVQPPISKSGINRRFKKIHELAEELKS